MRETDNRIPTTARPTLRGERRIAARLMTALAVGMSLAEVAPAAHAAPVSPTGTTVSATAVAWTDASATDSGFVVERCVVESGCTTWARVGWVPRNTTTLTDAFAPYSAATLGCQVRAFDATGFSAPSPTATVSRGISSTLFVPPPTVTVDNTDASVVHASASALNPLVGTDEGSGGIVFTQRPTVSGFGDGTGEETAAPTTTHTFDVGGTYAGRGPARDRVRRGRRGHRQRARPPGDHPRPAHSERCDALLGHAVLSVLPDRRHVRRGLAVLRDGDLHDYSSAHDDTSRVGRHLSGGLVEGRHGIPLLGQGGRDGVGHIGDVWRGHGDHAALTRWVAARPEGFEPPTF